MLTMTTQQADQSITKQGKLENNAPAIIEALAQGSTWSMLIGQYGCSKTAFAAFTKRHAAEIAERKQAIREHIQDVGLKDREERIRKLAWVADSIETELKERGFMWMEPFGRDREVLKMPTGAIAEYRSALDDIAREVGDRVPTKIDLSDRRTYVLNVIKQGGDRAPLG